jgi:hypothetical protein
MIYFVTELNTHTNQVNTWFFPTYLSARRFIQPSKIRGNWVSVIDEKSYINHQHPPIETIERWKGHSYRLTTFTKYNGKHILTISTIKL